MDLKGNACRDTPEHCKGGRTLRLRWLLGLLMAAVAVSVLTAAQQRRPVSYTKDIQPLMLKRCVACHGEKKAEHGLRLDSYDEIMKGDHEGPVVVPGKSAASRLYLVVAGKKEPKMPPEPLPPLTPLELELLRRWIDEGANNDAAAPSPKESAGVESALKPRQFKLQLLTVGMPSEVTVEFGPAPAVNAIAFAPDGKTLFVGGYKELLRWDLTAAQLAGRWSLEGMDGTVTAMAISKDGTRIAVAGGDPQRPASVTLLDATTGTPVQRFADPKGAVHHLLFSPDGRWLVAAGADKTVYVWDLAQRHLAVTLKEPGDWALGVTFSPDAKWLATGGADRIVRLWDVKSWRVVRKLEHPATVCQVAFQPNGNLLAVAMSGAGEGGIWIWNAETGQRLRALEDTRQPVSDVVWSGDGKLLVAALADNAVRLYDADGNLRATLQGHNAEVTTIAFHPDNVRFASASRDGTVRLWHTDGRLLAVLVQLAAGKDEWLIATPQGYFVAAGAVKLTVAQPSGATLAERWRNPEMVRRALAGEKLPPAQP